MRGSEYSGRYPQMTGLGVVDETPNAKDQILIGILYLEHA
jgi:hypothetical protein